MLSAARIAILVSARRIANRERLFLRVADRLAARGCRVTFLAAGPESDLAAALRGSYELSDISLLPTQLRGVAVPHGLRIATSVPYLASYLRKARPDVLFATSVPPNIVAALACRIAGFTGRVVLRQSNALRVNGVTGLAGVEGRWRDRLIPPLYNKADTIIANSAGVAANLVALGLDARRIVAIPNGVERDRVQALGRAIVPLPNGDPLIVTAGRLVRQKDHATLIRAFARLQAVLPSRLIILGDGPERRPLEILAQNLSVHDRIAFPGYQGNPYALFSRADLFVLSSRYEGMPNVLLEALACGLPIVSTDCPHGPAEILDDGRYGSLVPVGDCANLAREIACSLRAPRRPERQRARAREFDADKIAERYADILLPPWESGSVRRAAE